MFILRLSPGLANQMYEYAAGYALAKELGQELVLDIAECMKSPFGYLLDYFNIPAARKVIYSQVSITAGSQHENCDSALEFFSEAVILVKDEEQKKRYADNERVIIYADWDMINELSGYHNLYMCGYFFDRNKYYIKYWEEIRGLLTLKQENEEVRDFRKLIFGRTSVGIHIRRGDMLLAEWSVKMEDDYYRAAIECCKELHGNCVFCVFSDDIKYAESLLGMDESIHYIHFHGYDDASVNEFYCLSLCNHRILSNSSTFGRLADDLNWGKDRHVFTRDTGEDTKEISLAERSKGREIRLNTEDIKYYSFKFNIKEKVDNENSKSNGLSGYTRFLKLVQDNRNHEALQLAFCIYEEKRDDKEFKLFLAEALIRIGAYEESVVELAQLPLDIVRGYLKKMILSKEKKRKLILLYNAIRNVNNKHFIIVVREKAMPARRTYGLVDLAIVLSHLGHKVTLVYEPNSESDKYYLNASEYLKNARGINLGCYHVAKEVILKDGVSNFYNKLADDELVIISRDERFFEKASCEKKVLFITTDETDMKDEEIHPIALNKDVFDSLANKADYILTRNLDLATVNKKYIYWQDRGNEDTFTFIDVPWEYGYGQRLNLRMIGMAEALSNICHVGNGDGLNAQFFDS